MSEESEKGNCDLELMKDQTAPYKDEECYYEY